MLEAFSNGVDIHAQTAAEVFDVPIEDMDAETRRQAKAINFWYNLWHFAFGLARQLSIGRSEAARHRRLFRTIFGIQSYMEEAKAFAKTHQFVQTLFAAKSIFNKSPLPIRLSVRLQNVRLSMPPFKGVQQI